MSLSQAVQTTRPEYRSSFKKVRPLNRPIDLPKLGRSDHLTNAAVATPTGPNRLTLTNHEIIPETDTIPADRYLRIRQRHHLVTFLVSKA